MKTLEELDFAKCAKVSAQQIYERAKGDYIAKAEPDDVRPIGNPIEQCFAKPRLTDQHRPLS